MIWNECHKITVLWYSYSTIIYIYIFLCMYELIRFALKNLLCSQGFKPLHLRNKKWRKLQSPCSRLRCRDRMYSVLVLRDPQAPAPSFPPAVCLGSVHLWAALQQEDPSHPPWYSTRLSTLKCWSCVSDISFCSLTHCFYICRCWTTVHLQVLLHTQATSDRQKAPVSALGTAHPRQSLIRPEVRRTTSMTWRLWRSFYVQRRRKATAVNWVRVLIGHQGVESNSGCAKQWPTTFCL